jgi:hypothetical protein
MKELTESFSNIKNVFDESGKEIDLNQLQGDFGSYLFLW